MKLWLISQIENQDYDTYDSAIVAAIDEDSAKRIHPSDCIRDWGRRYSSWCQTPDAVTARLIGEASEGTAAGVILASFNAG